MRANQTRGFGVDQLRAPRPERQKIDPRKARRWLEANRVAWSGWPTTVALDDSEKIARIDRLMLSGFPAYELDSSDLPVIESQIAAIRISDRAWYVRWVSTLDV